MGPVSGGHGPAYVANPDVHQPDEFLGPDNRIFEYPAHDDLRHGDKKDDAKKKDRNPVDNFFSPLFYPVKM
jgi:hypothetical protein